MEQQVSTKTLAVLVLLVLVVSFISALATWSQVPDVPVKAESDDSSTGEVSFYIEPSLSSSATGQVALDIRPPEE